MCKQSRKIGENMPCEYSMSTIKAFDKIENNHSLYRGEVSMNFFVFF